MRLSLLLPARKHVESATAVARWLARGDRIDDGAVGRDAALRECFSTGAAILPTAALTRSLDANDAADALWLRADPAFVMADAVTLRLLACGKLGLSADETAAFAQTLKPLFGDAGFAFDAPHPERWYLSCASGAPLPKFSAPADALGDDLANHLPEGEQARRWRALLNEAQIALTQHPLNARRSQRGVPPVNSLWFWGAGMLPARVRSEFDRVVSDDPVVVALAGLANVPSSQLESNLRWDDGKERVLIDLADRRDIPRLDAEWLRPIDETLRRRRIERLELRFESGERHVVRPAHRWRFWRRAKTSA
ncbi:MAG: phosphoglycerate mutase [Rudaea sp.]|uniref:phosphoglycerate mutase n=1 Tax=Rudaea sp. TaxID=2136325 RepID=UPI0039E66BE7